MRPRGLTHDFPFCAAFEWMEHSPVGEFMRSSRVIFPIVESIHLIGLALFLGTLLLTDLGLLGWAMRRQPIQQVAGALAPWTWRGFALLMLTGPLMFAAQAAKWHDNPLFWIKLFLLLVAAVFQWSVRNARTRLIGAVSLILWITIGFLSKAMEFV